MIPKIASALARVLDPIKPIERPGQSVKFTKSSEGGEGGHGPLGYDAQNQPDSHQAPEDKKKDENPNSGTTEEKVKLGGLPHQPGLTQVILELNSQRTDHLSGSAVQSYETGAREQKKNSRLPKGSMLDKKAG